MSLLRAETARQAERITERAEALHPGAPARLRENALAELASWSEVRVSRVPDLDVGDGCSVAGSYRPDTIPPTLCIAWSASPGRRQFTALHELAHHLQQNDVELATAFITSFDPHGFEEGACNLFAGRTLLPDELVDRHIGSRGPAAAEVADLFADSQASRAACCARAAERLRSPGAVVLLDAAGAVSFAQSVGGFIPPARGSDQSATPLLARALRAGGRARTETVVWYRSGSTSDTVYGDCADAAGWLVAVLAAERAPWLKFSLPRPRTSFANVPWWTCETCGDMFRVDERCPACKQPKCPQQGHCSCSLAQEKVCTSCYLAKHASQFSGGTVCRECRE